jgi:hypothetical protein
MSRQSVGAVSMVLLLVVIGAFIVREKWRLGTVRWNIRTEPLRRPVLVGRLGAGALLQGIFQSARPAVLRQEICEGLLRERLEISAAVAREKLERLQRLGIEGDELAVGSHRVTLPPLGARVKP